VLATQLVAGSNNSSAYSYTGGGLVAARSASGSKLLMDIGSNSASGHGFKVQNAGNGVDGTLSYRGAAGAVRFSIDSITGNTTLNTGNLVIGTSGKGIDFSATSDGSGTMTSEVLDDYETGTWTPIFAFGAGSVGQTYDLQYATYTKVGNLVTATCYIDMNAVGSSTGGATVNGLPFVSRNVAGHNTAAALAYTRGITSVGAIQGWVAAGANIVHLYQDNDSGGNTPLNSGDFGADARIMMTISYAT